MAVINKTVDIGNGNIISIETGKLAKQADGSIVLKMGNTMLLATVVAEKDAGEEFFTGSNKQGFDFYSGHIFLAINMQNEANVKFSYLFHLIVAIKHITMHSRCSHSA